MLTTLSNVEGESRKMESSHRLLDSPMNREMTNYGTTSFTGMNPSLGNLPCFGALPGPISATQHTGYYLLHITMSFKVIGQAIILRALRHSPLLRSFGFEALGLPHAVKEIPSEPRQIK
jgi:hypothetical protein